MMTKERRKELESIADEDPHMCLLRELLNEIAELEARAVVLPELTNEDLNSYSMDCDERDAVEFGYNLAASRARAIPSDRVLGEGMVQVDREEWKHIVTLLVHLIGDEDAFEKIDDLLDPISKLREARDGRGWIGAMISGVIDVSTPEIDDFFVCPPSALRANQGGAAR